MTTTCDQVTAELSELVDGDPAAIARCAEHLAGCASCRDARHDATQLAARIAAAGADHTPSDDLAARVLAALDAATARHEPGAPRPIGQPASRRSPKRWAAIAASAAVVAAAAAMIALRATDEPPGVASRGPAAPGDPVGKLTRLERAGAGPETGVAIRHGGAWRALGVDQPVPAGAELTTDDRTRAALALSDGSQLVLDHGTAIAFAADDARQIRLTAGRLAADLAALPGRPAAITTPAGRIDAADANRAPDAPAARFIVTATDALTSVQVTRASVVLSTARGERDEVRAGEEGVIQQGALAVSPAPGLVRDAAWAELAPPAAPDEVASGLGALRAYKPGEQRDRDWPLALARHDVKIRVVGPIARTEITETFRNDSAATLEGVYQFPLPPDAQIDNLALDAAGGFVDGAFVDKQRGAKIWRGVIDRATPHPIAQPSQDIIWVEGRWRDPALLDWKRGGRFELRVYPIPAHGARTIKLAYTQVVAPRGAWRQYRYPLPHSRDGSTVADELSVDVELRGALPGQVRATGYALAADPARAEVNALTLHQAGFVPRGDLVIEYRAEAGDAELRAWTFAGGAAAAPDDKLAGKQRVGIDPRVVAAQRALAADPQPAAVLALRPRLPRWRDGAPRDYLIAIDDSQSMVGERFTRAAELAAASVAQMDRRDRFSAMVCDSECRSLGALRSPSPQAAGELARWLAAQQPAGASDVAGSLRAATQALLHDALPRDAGRAPWVLYIGDGFASTGFRRVGDVERAVAGATGAAGPRITTIGIGSDADAAVLQAAARGGGGSYLAWLPGERTRTAAAAALESTLGAALRDAVVELPPGLTDAAPSVLPTLRAGDEVLIAARVDGSADPSGAGLSGDVVLRGRVAGQPFEQRYPIRLAVSSAAGNGFVPRLWASLAIDQLERTGSTADRAQIVALSQGYGVMSRETSLLVLESQAMFDAFGVDRHRPAATWTGEDALDEVASSGTVALATGASSNGVMADAAGKGSASDRAAAAMDPYADPPEVPRTTRPAPAAPPATAPPTLAPKQHADKRKADDSPNKKAAEPGRWSPGADWIQLRRIWVRVPSVAAFDPVHPVAAHAIADAEAALAAHPDSRERHRALVHALAYAGELDRARDVARRWLDRDELDPEALGALADLLGRAGDRELALRTLAGLVDLDPDRAALHERMVRTYEQAGRLAQACAHRIALAALQPAAPAAAGAVRCLRATGRPGDAELILGALPDDAARAAVEKAALVAPLAPPVTGELVIKAHWDAPADLDVSLITPDGSRVSWLGGPGAIAGDATAADRETLAVRALRRGNYLVEISRASAAPDGPASPIPVLGLAPPAPPVLPVRGTLDITALGARRAIPFELTGARAVVGRVSVRLEQRFEDLDGTPVQLYNGPDRRILPDRPARVR
ncbi:MAG TPA: VIT domain-containing protein [Kofleriaceae bacterium]|nr:VIT domain-containing protein [Kofleriaceae bacterium]